MGRKRFGSIRKLPSGRIQAKYINPANPKTPDGTRNYITAPTTFATVGKADIWLAQVQASIAAETWRSPEQVEAERVQAEIQAAKDAWTFRAYATQWMKDRELRPSTVRPNQSYLDNHLLPYWDDTPLKAITTPKVKEWLAVLAPGHEGARRKSYELFRAIMNTAVEDDLIPYSPCKRDLLKRAKASPPQAGEKAFAKNPRRAITFDQLNALAETVPPYMALAVLWSGLVGFRPGEIRALQPKSLWQDGEGRLWVTVEQAVTGQGKHQIIGEPKTKGSNRPVPVPPSLRDDVEKAAAATGEDGFIFHPTGKPQSVIPEATYWENIQTASKRAGIGPVAPYDLRHTCITRARELDASGGTVTGALVGHIAGSMTDHYTHISQDAVFSLVEKMDRMRTTPPKVVSLDTKRA